MIRILLLLFNLGSMKKNYIARQSSRIHKYLKYRMFDDYVMYELKKIILLVSQEYKFILETENQK